MAFKLSGTEEQKAKQSREIEKQIIQNRCDQRYSSYHYPRNKDEWWKNVEDFWPELLNIAWTYAPMGSVELEFGTQRLAQEVEKLKHNKDIKLIYFFEKVWASAPDHGSIHTNKGWDVLCDLCSESGVLFED